MRNSLIIGIYAPFNVVTAFIFCIEIFRKYKRQEDTYFTLLCFYALGWYAVNIFGLLSPSVEVAKHCIQLMLIFVSLIPPTLLLFIIKFYKYEVPSRFPRFWPALLFVIPAITSVLAIGFGHLDPFTTQLEITSLSPIREMTIVWGRWFWVHTVYSYILSMIIIVLLLMQHRKVTHFYRLPSTMMVLGVGITLVGNVVTLLQVIQPVIEPTLITMSLSLIFFSLAIFNNNNSKFVRYSKAHIYNYLAEYILVLDEKNHIIDYNKAADGWFSSLDIPLNGASLESVTQMLADRGAVSYDVSDSTDRDDAGVDLRIKNNHFITILNRRIYQMKDVRGDSIGKIVVYSDVTENRMLIERLETKAGVDSLTGIPNHLAYTGAKKRLDHAEFYPLSVIICDANKLKATNDTMGHAYGDLMLQTMASILEDECPQNGFAARIGGDEFVLLLPDSPLDAAEELIARIRARFEASHDMLVPLSMAFGAATKTDESLALMDVIALADQRMYHDKESRRVRS